MTPTSETTGISLGSCYDYEPVTFAEIKDYAEERIRALIKAYNCAARNTLRLSNNAHYCPLISLTFRANTARGPILLHWERDSLREEFKIQWSYMGAYRAKRIKDVPVASEYAPNHPKVAQFWSMAEDYVERGII